jgi:pyridine nucleotide-disulfide oxidoreductase family protein
MRELVLAGAGHAHALVLRAWARQPLAGVRVTVVSPQSLAPYSGMVPGWPAGAYRFDEIAIDFERLCAAAGAHWIGDEIASLDPQRHELSLASGRRLSYELLSLNIGSTLRPPVLTHARVLSMRPLSALRVQWEAFLQDWQRQPGREPLSLVAVGGGAAGFESLLAVRAQLLALRPDRRIDARLVSRGQTLLPGVSAMSRALALRALRRDGVQLQLGTDVEPASIAPGSLVLWATGAQAHEWTLDAQRRGALAVSDQGFVCIDEQLRSTSHPDILAAGDCAHWAGTPLPKAGVYAVRMGPVLAHNLRAWLDRGELRTYEPQRRFLALLATADGSAIASRGPFGASGSWAWRWKDRIDRGFIARMLPPEVAQPSRT